MRKILKMLASRIMEFVGYSAPQTITRALLEESVTALLRQLPEWVKERKVTAAVILGSAWGGATQDFKVHARVPFALIPHLGKATALGHLGEIQFIEISGKLLTVFSGRKHFYESGDKLPVLVMAYITKALGAKVLFVTNAAGSLSSKYAPGSAMVIRDHLRFSLPDPLLGVEVGAFSDKLFNPIEPLYDRELSTSLYRLLQDSGINTYTGTYVGVSGPTYESGAEIRMFAQLVDHCGAVGMSTIIESIAAHVSGIKVVALSCITNFGAGLTEKVVDANEVVDELHAIMPKLQPVVRQFLHLLAEKF